MVVNFVIGTAAELIKVYPLLRACDERGHDVRVLATGQSRENLLMQFRDFGFDLGRIAWLVEGDDLERSSSALKWFARAFLAWGRARRALREGYVVVHGDTLSTLIGAFHGWRLRRPVVHVEAGLRSPRLLDPFPEEIDRRLVSRLTDVHFPPDARAAGHLRGEVVATSGNTLADAVRLVPEGTVGGGFALVNVHRFENLNSPARWKAIVDTVVAAASQRKVVFVMHPPTRHRLERDADAKAAFARAGVELRERMAFSAFVGLLKRADFLISDGGSNQEECSYLGKPCLVMRESTERTEGLDGCCVLSRFAPTAIAKFLAAPEAYARPARFPALSPTQIILDHLEQRKT